MRRDPADPGVRSGAYPRYPVVERPRKKSHKAVKIAATLVAVIFLALFGAAGYYAYKIFGVLRNPEVFVTPIIAQPSPLEGQGQGQGGDGQSNEQPTQVPAAGWEWNGQERINILLLGVDKSDQNSQRSDTMILATIDPKTKTVGMLALPRDLWVDIPNFGKERINAAYTFGENKNNGVPGGGPALAKQTVANVLGVPVHYFIEVDFKGLQDIVDTIGGVTIDVPKPLKDDEYPDETFGYQRIYIPVGIQHMDGKTALEYARSRHVDDDLGRNRRQMQVIMAIRQQGLKLDLISKADQLLSALEKTFRTDVPPGQVLPLLRFAKGITPENIVTRSFDWTMVTSWKTPTGADVLLPNWPAIKDMVSSMMSDPQLAGEAAKVEVRNGTQISGLASAAQARLQGAGIDVVGVSQSQDPAIQQTTTIYDITGKSYTARLIASSLGLPESSIKEAAPEEGSEADILVLLGEDAQGIVQ